MASMESIETCVLESLEMALLYFRKTYFCRKKKTTTLFTELLVCTYVVMKLEVGSVNSLEHVLCKPPIDKHCAFRSH